MSRTTKKTKKNKLNIIIPIILIIVICLLAGFTIRNNYLQNEELRKETLKKEILSHYNEYVITNKESEIYTLTNSEYQKSGKVGKGQELTLDTKDITYEDEYLKIKTFESEYYIYYKDIDIIEDIKILDNRYKQYIVFNKNIITKNITNFYDEEDNLIYTLNKSFNLPIIINKENIFGVEFNNRLLYIKKEDVSEVVDSKNTELDNTSGIAVLNYHFFYDDSKQSEINDCNQIICLSTTNLKKQLDYITNNHIFTPTMKELEMYIDGYLRLPKSVVLTIDDGWRADIGSNIMADYKLNATVFLMSADYDPNPYSNDFVEVHSHGHALHKAGVCPGGQGGAIKCLEKSKLLEDLSASRKKLDNTTVFCYPFYEYNNYSIEVLKEAGFTMAFGGYGEEGKYKVSPGINKYKLPRYIVYNNTTTSALASYIN